MKKVFYLSPIAFLVSTNVLSASINDYSKIETTNLTTPTIAATANHSIAIGPESSVNQNDAYTSASKNKKGRYSGVYSIAEGYKATVYGSQSIAYGHEAVANGWLSYAIGSRANAEGDGNIALGGSAKSLAGAYYGNPSSGGAIAVGLESNTIGNGAIAMGNKASATGVKSIAIGNDARTLDITNIDGAANIDQNVKNNIKSTVETLRKQNSPIDMAAELLGLSDEATSTIAIGDESRAIGWGSTALGTKAYALNDRATTLGDDSKTLGYAGTSVGTHAYSFGKGASALGTWAEALGDYSTAAGPSSSAAGNNSIAMGNGASASGLNAISIGSMTTDTKAWYTTNGGRQVHRAEHEVWNATGDHSIALGTDSQAIKESAIAIGKEALAEHKRSVALGDKSSTENAKDTPQGTVNGITYGNFAGATSVGTVSVGNSTLGETRQIKNVSAGDISPTSTDAINGSQLYLIANKLTEEIKNIQPKPTPVPPTVNVDTGDISVNDNGIVVADSTKGNLASVTDVANAINNSSFNITTGSEDGGKAINVTIEKVKAGNTVAYKAGKNMVVKQDGQNITYSTTDKPIFDVVNANEFKAGDVVVNNQGINAGNKKITNVAEGTKDSDGVNYAQLRKTNNQVRQLENKLNRVDRKLRGGIAQAGAMANIPQVTRNGASGVGVGVASYRDENAISVGYSLMSDNGKHIIKTSVGLDTRGYNMVGAGYMYQW
ncbi:YadA family autotransporter adhesin [Rodentibacter pneumotropicus]|uniref:Autotransporter adhesin n=1 Tax=Rodentibacter pneumotropicus TaxID=758 RepID=A0A4S2P8N7_9PAST|nr:YadA-like family protein [Rodentibacter pneumotropicus]TGZ99389.1 hypothetical protein D3M79_06540 [Rodentibacter pneumotropicus]THA01020.1 hypothetical protein D3M74_06195 [Rodentibacter pneumotropicus]THA05981.1 hypothetical protein D3M77_08665 [Rodentibacter pneumotropicus]THA18006.1 hypothetical protein D3M76_00270 [Rodentibacter pneumotropicus]